MNTSELIKALVAQENLSDLIHFKNLGSGKKHYSEKQKDFATSKGKRGKGYSQTAKVTQEDIAEMAKKKRHTVKKQVLNHRPGNLKALERNTEFCFLEDIPEDPGWAIFRVLESLKGIQSAFF